MSDFIKAIGEGIGGKFDPSEANLVEIAKQVGAELNKHYANHPWIIGVQGGSLMVRHRAIADVWKMATGKEGCCWLLPPDKLGTPREVARSAVQAGGAMLEAFGLKRGAWQGEMPVAPRHMVLAAIKSNGRVLQ